MYSTGIDAFTVDWYGVNGLLVPPMFLIPCVFKCMGEYRAIRTLIVPCWPSENYWSMLCPSGNGFIDHNSKSQFYHFLTLGFKPYQC
jgi:hypothetical protein